MKGPRRKLSRPAVGRRLKNMNIPRPRGLSFSGNSFPKLPTMSMPSRKRDPIVKREDLVDYVVGLNNTTREDMRKVITGTNLSEVRDVILSSIVEARVAVAAYDRRQRSFRARFSKLTAMKMPSFRSQRAEKKDHLEMEREKEVETEQDDNASVEDVGKDQGKPKDVLAEVIDSLRNIDLQWLDVFRENIDETKITPEQMFEIVNDAMNAELPRFPVKTTEPENEERVEENENENINLQMSTHFPVEANP